MRHNLEKSLGMIEGHLGNQYEREKYLSILYILSSQAADESEAFLRRDSEAIRRLIEAIQTNPNIVQIRNQYKHAIGSVIGTKSDVGKENTSGHLSEFEKEIIFKKFSGIEESQVDEIESNKALELFMDTYALKGLRHSHEKDVCERAPFMKQCIASFRLIRSELKKHEHERFMQHIENIASLPVELLAEKHNEFVEGIRTKMKASTHDIESQIAEVIEKRKLSTLFSPYENTLSYGPINKEQCVSDLERVLESYVLDKGTDLRIEKAKDGKRHIYADIKKTGETICLSDALQEASTLQTMSLSEKALSASIHVMVDTMRRIEKKSRSRFKNKDFLPWIQRRVKTQWEIHHLFKQMICAHNKKKSIDKDSFRAEFSKLRDKMAMLGMEKRFIDRVSAHFGDLLKYNAEYTAEPRVHFSRVNPPKISESAMALYTAEHAFSTDLGYTMCSPFARAHRSSEALIEYIESMKSSAMQSYITDKAKKDKKSLDSRIYMTALLMNAIHASLSHKVDDYDIWIVPERKKHRHEKRLMRTETCFKREAIQSYKRRSTLAYDNRSAVSLSNSLSPHFSEGIITAAIEKSQTVSDLYGRLLKGSTHSEIARILTMHIKSMSSSYFFKDQIAQDLLGSLQRSYQTEAELLEKEASNTDLIEVHKDIAELCHDARIRLYFAIKEQIHESLSHGETITESITRVVKMEEFRSSSIQEPIRNAFLLEQLSRILEESKYPREITGKTRKLASEVYNQNIDLDTALSEIENTASNQQTQKKIQKTKKRVVYVENSRARSMNFTSCYDGLEGEKLMAPGTKMLENSPFSKNHFVAVESPDLENTHHNYHSLSEVKNRITDFFKGKYQPFKVEGDAIILGNHKVPFLEMYKHGSDLVSAVGSFSAKNSRINAYRETLSQLRNSLPEVAAVSNQPGIISDIQTKFKSARKTLALLNEESRYKSPNWTNPVPQELLRLPKKEITPDSYREILGKLDKKANSLKVLSQQSDLYEAMCAHKKDRKMTLGEFIKTCTKPTDENTRKERITCAMQIKTMIKMLSQSSILAGLKPSGKKAIEAVNLNSELRGIFFALMNQKRVFESDRFGTICLSNAEQVKKCLGLYSQIFNQHISELPLQKETVEDMDFNIMTLSSLRKDLSEAQKTALSDMEEQKKRVESIFEKHLILMRGQKSYGPMIRRFIQRMKKSSSSIDKKITQMDALLESLFTRSHERRTLAKLFKGPIKRENKLLDITALVREYDNPNKGVAYSDKEWSMARSFLLRRTLLSSSDTKGSSHIFSTTRTESNSKQSGEKESKNLKTDAMKNVTPSSQVKINKRVSIFHLPSDCDVRPEMGLAAPSIKLAG